MNTILVTGAAGFIGSKVAEKLLEQGFIVIGVDNLNGYYSVGLKLYRLKELEKYSNFEFYRADIENIDALREIYRLHCPDAVINEAARAGVRYSLENPHIYLSTNAGGCLNLLELCREYNVPKFVLASTSSLYAGQKIPFVEDLPVNTPISPYAVSKKAAEAMVYTYHNLYGLDVTVLRYFTVYGPAGRPDMSYFRFAKWIMEGSTLEVFGDGKQSRDFTYIDDIAAGTVKSLKNMGGCEIINLGNSKPEKLEYLIRLTEKFVGREASIKYKNFHQADMTATWADTGKAKRLLNWSAKISLEEGIKRTVGWMKDNRRIISQIKL